MKRISTCSVIAVIACAIAACTPAPPAYDLIIRGGTVYDGLGGEPFVGDIAITGDRITAGRRVDLLRGHQGNSWYCKGYHQGDDR